MDNLRKKIRFAFWFIKEYITSHFSLIIIAFSVVFILILLLATLQPFITKFILGKEKKVGKIGAYSYKNPPPDVLKLISKPPFEINKKGEIIPILIEQWEMRDQGRRFRLFFKKNLIWNDGSEFRVDDIKDTLLKNAEVKKLDDYTLEITLQKPTIILPYYLTKPIYKYPLVGIGGRYSIVDAKVQKGLFKQIKISQKQGKDIIVFNYYDSESQLINAFKAGKIDELESQNRTLIEELKNWNNVNIKTGINYSSLPTLFFNLENDFLKEDKFREAIDLLIPWNDLKTYGEISKGPIPPNSLFFNKRLKPKITDEEKAIEIIKNIVEEKKDSKQEIKIRTDYRLLFLAEYLSAKLQQNQINTSVEIVNNLNSLDFDMLLVFWNVPLDIDQYFFWHSTQSIEKNQELSKANISRYRNLKVDKLLENSRSTLQFSEQIIALYKFQEEITRDRPAIFLYFPYIYLIQRKNIF